MFKPGDLVLAEFGLYHKFYELCYIVSISNAEYTSIDEQKLNEKLNVRPSYIINNFSTIRWASEKQLKRVFDDLVET